MLGQHPGIKLLPGDAKWQTAQTNKKRETCMISLFSHNRGAARQRETISLPTALPAQSPDSGLFNNERCRKKIKACFSSSEPAKGGM